MEYQDPTDADLLDLAAQIFAGTVKNYDANGHYEVEGYDGQALQQVPIARPYGYLARAPTATGLVLATTTTGVLVVSERNNLPAGVAALAEGEVALYNSQGCQIRLDSNGHIVHEPKSGGFVKLGSGASKKVVLDADDVNKDTGVPGFDFASWMASMEVLANAGTGGVCSPTAASITKLGEVKTSATKAKAE